MYKGIDVSQWQGVIDWDTVKASGIEFAIIRAGYGQNNIDKKFIYNITECNRLGIPCGVYWFSYALTAENAAQEARYCIEAVKPYILEYPVCFDLEGDTKRYAEEQGVTITKELASEMVHAFCGEVENLGYYAVNYTNLDYTRNMFETSVINSYDIWYAREEQYIDREDMGLWQYTWTGQVNGINGNVDMDYSLEEYPTIIRAERKNGLKPLPKKGDIDGDGDIDSKDYLMLKRIFLGTYTPTEEEAIRASSIDDSGISSKAYIKLKRAYLGTYTLE